jgi:Ca2+/Na+ antiporter
MAISGLTALWVGAGLGLAAWLGSGLTDVYGWTGSLGTVAVILVYMLGNLALIVYFARDAERHLLKHVLFPLAGIAALGYPLYFVAKPGQAYPYNLVPYIVLAWIVWGFVTFFWFRAKDPAKLAAVGKILAEDTDDVAESHLLSAPV